MARGRNNNKLTKIKKIEPAELNLLFSIEANPTGKRTYIDLSQCASLVNRRFYRQGLAWAVAGFTLHSLPGSQGTLTIQKLPSTWTFSNAWHKSMATWSKMNDEALEETESVRPRFLDFKIYADKQHHERGYDDNLLPFVYNTAGSRITAYPGMWEASKMVIPDTTSPTGGTHTRELIGVGENYPGLGASGFNAVSLIEGYANSRALPAIVDPNVPDDTADADGATPENWMVATFNEGTEQDDKVLDDMISENNQAPYPFENDGTSFDTRYPGGEHQLPAMVFVDRMSTQATTETGFTNRTTARGGVFPCGIIQLSDPFGTLEGAILQVHLVPGNHRGYLAEPMQDM